MHSSPSDDLLLITVKTAKSKPLLTGTVARDAITSLYRVQCFNPFLLHAFVVMPDHVHLLLGGARYGHLVSVIQKWKNAVSQEIGKDVWQHRFDIQLVSPSMRTIEHLHANPVRRGLVMSADEYQWSSACDRWETAPLPQYEEAPLLQRMQGFQVCAGAR